MLLSDITFPNNIVVTLKEYLETIAPPVPNVDPLLADPGIPVFARPLSKNDPNQCIGVSAGMWTPEEDSYEMNGPLSHQGPTISRYIVGVQTYIKHTDEMTGLATSATLSGAVRNKIMLTSAGAHPLIGLTSTEFGYRETVKKVRILSQRFVGNEIQGQFLYLSNLEVVVETEIGKL